MFASFSQNYDFLLQLIIPVKRKHKQKKLQNRASMYFKKNEILSEAWTLEPLSPVS